MKNYPYGNSKPKKKKPKKGGKKKGN